VVPPGIVGDIKIDLAHKQYHQGIANDCHHCGGGGGSETEDTDFRGCSGEDAAVGFFGNGTVGVAGYDDDRDLREEIILELDELDYLPCLS